MSAPQRRARGQELKQEFPTSEYPKSSLLSDDFSRRVRRVYKDENCALFEKWMPEYMDYSY
jgi:hypothetical protein